MKKITSFSSALLVLSIIAPSVMMAQTTSVTPTSTSTGFCSNVDAYIQKVDQNLGQKESNYDAKKVTQAQTKAQKQADQDASRQKARDNWSSKRDATFTKLSNKATTDAQKSAVTAYQSAITAAVQTEQSAVDAAISAYRTSMATITANRKTLVDTALKTLQSSVDAAAAQAKTDCSNGVDPKTAKATLVASIKTAKSTFAASIKDTTQMKSDIKTAEQTRKDAISKAHSDYKTAHDAAVATLKSAFGQ